MTYAAVDLDRDLQQPDEPQTPILALEPVFSGTSKLVYIAGFGAWLAAMIFFWTWWAQPAHIQSVPLFLLMSLVIAWITVIPAYFMLIFYRARIVKAGSAPLVPGRIALVATKAPSEPLSVVQKTLTAMLGQIDYDFDVWLADEDPTEETVEWCTAHGVRISTRKGIKEYHQAEWPRRTRCKEGNLAYFYDHYGYDGYDYVAQFDADHVPESTYLREVIKPFVDPQVGYVSAPSICDANAASSWSARGRLYAEASMHGSLQVGYNDRWAPLCIGSHYAVRTAALRHIGGLGPELAEDHSTTLLMNSGGWRGIHAINAIAHGDGPQTFADLAVQEFQWSRSLTTILLQYLSQYMPSLPAKLKFQFVFAQLWYPLFSLFMALMYVLPLVAITLNRNFADVRYIDFFLHFSPISVVLISFAFFWRRTRTYRPVDAKIVSWENIMFVFARWPWSFAGCLASVRDHLTGVFVDFKITPKGTACVDYPPTRVMLPYVLLSLVSAAVAALVPAGGAAAGFYIFAIFNAVIYAALVLVIIGCHVRENAISPLPKSRGSVAVLMLVALSFGVSAYAIQQRGLSGMHALMAGVDMSAVPGWPYRQGPATPVEIAK